MGSLRAGMANIIFNDMKEEGGGGAELFIQSFFFQSEIWMI